MRRAACVLLWLGTAAGSRYHPVTPGDEVCVVITGYNTADTVGDAVASVLQQSRPVSYTQLTLTTLLLV